MGFGQTEFSEMGFDKIGSDKMGFGEPSLNIRPWYPIINEKVNDKHGLKKIFSWNYKTVFKGLIFSNNFWLYFSFYNFLKQNRI